MTLFVDSLKDVDFTKYKRFFVIGCSWTKWDWPTWADIIAKQYPHLDFYNYGAPGMGNTYIQTTLNQIEKYYHLTNTDLVAIMWSSFNRMDHYYIEPVKDRIIANMRTNEQHEQLLAPQANGQYWHCMHNMVASQSLTNDAVCDDRGAAIRDCAIIDSVSTRLGGAGYDSFQAMAIGIEQQYEYDESIRTYVDDVIALYKQDINHSMITEDLATLGYTAGGDRHMVNWFPVGVGFEESDGDEMVTDDHPTPKDWLRYLNHAGFKPADDITAWVLEKDARVRNAAYAAELLLDPSWGYGQENRRNDLFRL